jgi:hypothetical protein
MPSSGQSSGHSWKGAIVQSAGLDAAQTHGCSIANMAALGLSLSVERIVQPLCNGRLVAKQDYQVSDKHFKVSGNLIEDDDAKVRLLMAQQ